MSVSVVMKQHIYIYMYKRKDKQVEVKSSITVISSYR